MLARTGSTAGKAMNARRAVFGPGCICVETNKNGEDSVAFDSFVALRRPSTSEERPLGEEEEEGGVKRS